MKVSPSSDTVI